MFHFYPSQLFMTGIDNKRERTTPIMVFGVTYTICEGPKLDA